MTKYKKKVATNYTNFHQLLFNFKKLVKIRVIRGKKQKLKAGEYE